MLQYLQLPIVDTRSCADSYARFSANSRTPIIVNESQLCAQGTANRDACQGITNNFHINRIFYKYKMDIVSQKWNECDRIRVEIYF